LLAVLAQLANPRARTISHFTVKNLIFLAAALLALAPTATVAPLDTKGIPADAQGIVHIDCDLFAKSALVAALQQQADQKKYEAFKTQYGFDPAKDLASVTIGITKGNAITDTPPAFFGVARGKFPAEKITAAAKQAGARVTTEGGRTLIEGIDLDADTTPMSPMNNISLCILDPGTILFAQGKVRLDKVIAARAGKTKSYAAPATLAKLGAQTATPLIIGYFGGDLMPDAQDSGSALPVPITIPKADSISFLIAENNANLLFRGRSAFANADDAQQLQGTIQMITGFMQMLSLKAGSPGKQGEARLLQNLLSTLQTTLDDTTLDTSFSLPVADLVKALQTYAK